MLEGTCLNCGYVCIGWALQYPRNQSCPKCGMPLQIKFNGRIFQGYSPFTAEEYKLKFPHKSTPDSEKVEDAKKLE